jgi:hypothetical protein
MNGFDMILILVGMEERERERETRPSRSLERRSRNRNLKGLISEGRSMHILLVGVCIGLIFQVSNLHDMVENIFTYLFVLKRR